MYKTLVVAGRVIVGGVADRMVGGVASWLVGAVVPAVGVSVGAGLRVIDIYRSTSLVGAGGVMEEESGLWRCLGVGRGGAVVTAGV